MKVKLEHFCFCEILPSGKKILFEKTQSEKHPKNVTTDFGCYKSNPEIKDNVFITCWKFCMVFHYVLTIHTTDQAQISIGFLFYD